MSSLAKLAGFVAVLAVALGASFGIGNAVGPVVDADQGHGHSEGQDRDSDAGDQAGGHGQPGQDGHPPGGLMVSQDGYTLALEETELEPGPQEVQFRVTDAAGDPVTAYVPNHEKDLHLIAVRRDATGFQHVHPTLDRSGTWTGQVDLSAGTWRFFADVQPTGTDEPMTLGADAHVTGSFAPKPVPAPSQTATVGDYTVTLDGELAPGKERDLTLSVAKGGKPVTDLEPYLGAYGHLVALRSGDLAYLHVHPEGEPGDGTTKPGPQITFSSTAPSAGTYRLFLDFKHEGKVRTAEFTLATPPTGGQPGPTTSNPPAPETTSDGHGDHDH